MYLYQSKSGLRGLPTQISEWVVCCQNLCNATRLAEARTPIPGTNPDKIAPCANATHREQQQSWTKNNGTDLSFVGFGAWDNIRGNVTEQH